MTIIIIKQIIFLWIIQIHVFVIIILHVVAS